MNISSGIGRGIGIGIGRGSGLFHIQVINKRNKHIQIKTNITLKITRNKV